MTSTTPSATPPGALPLDDRLAKLETAVESLGADRTKHSTLLWVIVGLAAALPLSLILAGILKKGEPGENGANGRNGRNGRNGTPGVSVPVGGVIAWPGKLPEGLESDTDPWPHDGSRWRVCDGRSYAPSEEADSAIFDVLGTLYEEQSGPTANGSVRLPNFQGMFLRGAGSQTIGPDDEPLEFQSDLLGEAVPDLFRKHRHCVAVPTQGDNVGHMAHDAPIRWRSNSEGEHKYQLWTLNSGEPNVTAWMGPGEPVGGKETRPVNYAVHWLIRVE